MTTGAKASTLTPGNSEAPREAVGELGLLERYDALRERAEDRQELTLNAVPSMTHSVTTSEATSGTLSSLKVSSPELVSLAAEYLALSDSDLAHHLSDPASVAEVQRLAASVLAQAEGTPHK